MSTQTNQSASEDEEHDHLAELPSVKVTSNGSHRLRMFLRSKSRAFGGTSDKESREPESRTRLTAAAIASESHRLPLSSQAMVPATHQQRFNRRRHYNLVSREKLHIPKKDKDGRYHLSSSNTGDLADPSRQPLVSLMEEDIGEDEDHTEEEAMLARKMTNRELKEQLLKDGYNLDVRSDDEDLDLIPPRPMDEQTCCSRQCASCAIM